MVATTAKSATAAAAVALLLACCGVLLVEADVVHYTYTGSGTYNSGSFYVNQITGTTRTWKSNQQFTDSGSVFNVMGDNDWAACTSGIQVIFGSSSGTVSASVANYNYYLTFSFGNTVIGGAPYYLEIGCPAISASIRFDNYYTVTDCGTFSPSVISAITVSPSSTTITNMNQFSTVMMSGTNINQCDQAWVISVGGVNVTATYVSRIMMVFVSPPIVAPGIYPIVVSFAPLWPRTYVVGNLTYITGNITAPDTAVTNSVWNGRYFSWNTFDYSAGGQLMVFGTHLGWNCLTAQWFLVAQGSGAPAAIPCANVNTDSVTGKSVVTFAVPPNPKGANIGYVDTYRFVLGAANNATYYSTIPILYGLGYSDHYEQIDFDVTWTGPWSGSVTSSVHIQRDGSLVSLALNAYPFNGGAYAGSAATIQSTTPIPARFRPNLTKKRCYAHIRYGGDGYDLHMDIGGNGLIAMYKDSTGDAFTSSPNVYPSTCNWDIPDGAY